MIVLMTLKDKNRIPNFANPLAHKVLEQIEGNFVARLMNGAVDGVMVFPSGKPLYNHYHDNNNVLFTKDEVFEHFFHCRLDTFARRVDARTAAKTEYNYKGVVRDIQLINGTARNWVVVPDVMPKFDVHYMSYCGMYRIRSCKDFVAFDGTKIKAGTFGGRVDHMKTLSHVDSSWIEYNSLVRRSQLENCYVMDGCKLESVEAKECKFRCGIINDSVVKASTVVGSHVSRSRIDGSNVFASTVTGSTVSDSLVVGNCNNKFGDYSWTSNNSDSWWHTSVVDSEINGTRVVGNFKRCKISIPFDSFQLGLKEILLPDLVLANPLHVLCLNTFGDDGEGKDLVVLRTHRFGAVGFRPYARVDAYIQLIHSKLIDHNTMAYLKTRFVD